MLIPGVPRPPSIPIRIDHWRAIRVEDWSTAPVMLAPGARIHGRLDNDARKPILTTPVFSVDGRVVTTSSGSRYELGAPDPEYDAWLESQGITLDTTRPGGGGR